MNLLVFTKRVPATQEEEVRIIDDGKAVDLSKVPFKVNDWDNYSVEAAAQIALPWVVRLRYAMAAGQMATAILVDRALHIALPLGWMVMGWLD